IPPRSSQGKSKSLVPKTQEGLFGNQGLLVRAQGLNGDRKEHGFVRVGVCPSRVGYPWWHAVLWPKPRSFILASHKGVHRRCASRRRSLVIGDRRRAGTPRHVTSSRNKAGSAFALNNQP